MVNWTNSLVTGILTDDSNLHKTQTDTGPAVPIPGTTWIGGYKIGQGGFGFITLWVLIEDATRAPLNQVIIKDFFDRDSTLEEGPYTGVYDDLVRKGLDFGVDSTRPIGSAQVFYRFCKEAYLQGIMTEPDQDKQLFSVPLWGYASKPKLNDTNKIYNHWRLYMPLYDYGDLSHLIHQHQFMKKAIPEPFLWHTLICLVTAALQMEEQARKLPNSSDSDVIIVFDIKPQNILLAPPGGDTFPVYPRPHLADLGGGFLSNDQDMDNIHNNQGFCFTRGYLAPEMSQAGYNMNNDARFSTQRLRGSHTNM
jgi:serine/threonine protein kinase